MVRRYSANSLGTLYSQSIPSPDGVRIRDMDRKRNHCRSQLKLAWHTKRIANISYLILCAPIDNQDMIKFGDHFWIQNSLQRCHVKSKPQYYAIHASLVWAKEQATLSSDLNRIATATVSYPILRCAYNRTCKSTWQSRRSDHLRSVYWLICAK